MNEQSNEPLVVGNESIPDIHNDVYSKTIMGFWLYLITDFMLFATLFAVYAVLHKNNFGGPTTQDIINIKYVMIETLVLLVCSFTIGLAGACAHRKKKGWTIALFFVTFVFGALFMCMQFYEFVGYVKMGASWQRSGFLSAFFTVVGTFWVHIIIGVLWIIVFTVPVCIQGLTDVNVKRLTCLRMFWQFLSIVWAFIFSIVYLIGVIV